MFSLRKEQVPYAPISITLETEEDYQMLISFLRMYGAYSKSLYPRLHAMTKTERTAEDLHERLLELRNK